MMRNLTRIARASLPLLCGLGLGCAVVPYAEVRPERFYERWPDDDVRYRKVGDLEVSVGAFNLLGFPVAIPNLAATIDARIQDANADAVTNLEVETRWIGLLVFNYALYVARGDLISFE